MKFIVNVWNAQLLLLISSISTYAFLNFGVLPLNLSHIITLSIFMVILALALMQVKIKLNKPLLLLFLAFGVLSVYSLVIFSDMQKIKNLINFFIFFFVSAVVTTNCDKIKIVTYYIIMTKLFVFFALLQMVLYYSHLGNLYTFSFLGLKEVNLSTSGYFIRLFSLATEPAALCGILLPAIYLSINRIINKEKQVSLRYAIIVIFVVLNTFSLIGYLYIFIALIMAFYYGGKISFGKIALLIFAMFIFIILIMQAESIQQRVSEATSLDSIASSDNLSIMAVYSNILIMLEVLKEYPLLGGGIFNHPHFYDTYISMFYSGGAPRVELNKDEAASLYIRSLSETGILGFVSLVGLLVYILKRCTRKGCYNAYAISFALAFILLGIRAGSVNYIIIWFYFFGALRLSDKEQSS